MCISLQEDLEYSTPRMVKGQRGDDHKNGQGYPYVKRCRIEKYILKKGYALVPDNCTVLKMTLEEDGFVTINYKPKPRVRVLEESFRVSDFAVKGVKAMGVRLASREARSAKFVRDIEE